MSGSVQQTERLQKAANGVLGRRKFDWRKVEVNGDLSRRTLDAINMAAWLMGFSEGQLRKIHRGNVTPHVFQTMTRQKERPPAMKKRDRERRDEAAKLRRRHRQGRLNLRSVKIHSAEGGAPHYGGTTDIMGQLVAPFLVGRYGLPLGSGKRTPAYNKSIGGSPTSDHLTTNLFTFARDFPTWDGEAAARALARLFGWKDWQPNSYATFDFSVGQRTFRLQILWGAAIGHDDHIHVGISLVGGP
jgi:hypothetical protein